jgi:flagellar motor protein MotB
MEPTATDPASVARDRVRKKTEDPAKEKRREKMTEMSSRVSEICRLILFGVLALGYGIFSGESTFSRSLVSQNEILLKCLVGLAALGVAFDFAQYASGYRSADIAFRNASGDYEYKEDTIYWIWNNSYYAKITLTMMILIMISLISAKTLLTATEKSQSNSQITYLAFEIGKDRPSPLFVPQIARIADNANTNKLRLVELTGATDANETNEQFGNLAQRRAQNIARLLIDAGIHSHKVRIRQQSVGKTFDPLGSFSERAVQVKIEMEGSK